ncbi:MAG: heme exporter protein CcmD [Methyloligellaceae bacterium]
MFDLGPHAGFIIASYVCAIAILMILIGWIYLSRRKLNQQMAVYEEQGLLRKSSSSGFED